MKADEARTFDVPVSLLALRLEIDTVSQPAIQQID
jgi:hypothetical protein